MGLQVIPVVSSAEAGMNATQTAQGCSVAVGSAEGGGFELRFDSLFHQGRALSFPCDAQGHVDMDGLTERARSNYMAARALVGHDYSAPHVVAAVH